jgi:hypothetical protein
LSGKKDQGGLSIVRRTEMRKAALMVSGLIFAIISIGHFVRYFKAWIVQVGDYSAPVDFSLYGGIFFALLALWNFWASRNA